MAVPLRLGGPDRPPGGTRRTGYTTRGSQGWSAPPALRNYSGPVYGSWTGTRARPPKIKNAKQRALLFIRNTNGPGGRWVARRPATGAVPKLTPPPAPVVAPAPGTNNGYTGPYAEYPEWARRVLQGIDTDQTNHYAYLGYREVKDPVTGKVTYEPNGSGVSAWLKSAMDSVNTIAGGMLGDYTNNAGNVADTVAQAAGATPMQVNSPLAGGIVSSPTAYDYIGRSQGMAAQGQAIRAEADAYATQSRTNLGLASQGYLNSLADYARGLPAVYAEKRRGAREEIDKFLAEAESEAQQLALDAAKFEETQRSNKADEAIRTLNARNGLITALVNAGVKIDANTLRAIDMAADNQRQQAADRVRAEDVRADNTRADANLARQTRADAARAANGGTSGRTAAWYQQRGYVRPGGNVNVGRIDRSRFREVGRDNTGQVWVLPKGASGGGGSAGSRTTPSTPTPVNSLVQDLTTDYRNTIEVNRPQDPAGAASDVVKWIKSNRSAFTRPDGSVDMGKVLKVLNSSLGNDTSVAGSVPARAWRLFQSGLKKQGAKYYWGR